MMKYISILTLFILVQSCSTDINGFYLTKQQYLKRLSKNIIVGQGNIYDVDVTNIILPEKYDTIAWNRGVLGPYYFSDSLLAKYCVYYSKVIKMEKWKLHYSAIEKLYGEPTQISTNKGRVTDFNYLFNTRTSPNCGNFEKLRHLHYKNCAILIFQFDKNGFLRKIHGEGFWP